MSGRLCWGKKSRQVNLCPSWARVAVASSFPVLQFSSSQQVLPRCLWGQGERETAFSPSLFVQLPPTAFPSAQLPPPGPSFDEGCAGFNEPDCTPGNYDTLTYGESHQLRRRRGYAKQDSTSALQTRQATMDALGRRWARGTQIKAEIT